MSYETKTAATWPNLAFENWKDTLATVHMWTQIVGKVRLRKMPWFNHSWHVTLYVSATGLSTGSVPYKDGVFQVDFDFIHHVLHITTSRGNVARVELYSRSVADFYRELFEKLESVEIDAYIYPAPNEIEQAIPFEKDETHCSYDREKMHNFYLALVKMHKVFTRFRAGFRGKCSPVHFFWGAFDLAVTRFSGRPAPLHPGGAPHMPAVIMQEAYSHEVSSCGFWPGNEQFPHPVFYSYCYPTPAEFAEHPVKPVEAFYSAEMGEFLLLYEVVQRSDDPEEVLMQFLQSTYDAAANTGHWDRESLECDLTCFEK